MISIAVPALMITQSPIVMLLLLFITMGLALENILRDVFGSMYLDPVVPLNTTLNLASWEGCSFSAPLQVPHRILTWQG